MKILGILVFLQLIILFAARKLRNHHGKICQTENESCEKYANKNELLCCSSFKCSQGENGSYTCVPGEKGLNDTCYNDFECESGYCHKKIFSRNYCWQKPNENKRRY
jgi:hypothetical protein